MTSDGKFITTAGICQSLKAPEFQIRGATPYDQEWSDTQTEVIVAGCGHARPKPRPAELDRVALPAPPPKILPKKRFIDRFKSRAAPVS